MNITLKCSKYLFNEPYYWSSEPNVCRLTDLEKVAKNFSLLKIDGNILSKIKSTTQKFYFTHIFTYFFSRNIKTHESFLSDLYFFFLPLAPGSKNIAMKALYDPFNESFAHGLFAIYIVLILKDIART